MALDEIMVGLLFSERIHITEPMRGAQEYLVLLTKESIAARLSWPHLVQFTSNLTQLIERVDGLLDAFEVSRPSPSSSIPETPYLNGHLADFFLGERAFERVKGRTTFMKEDISKLCGLLQSVETEYDPPEPTLSPVPSSLLHAQA